MKTNSTNQQAHWQARTDLERDFIMAFLIAACKNLVSPRDIAAICPPHFLHNAHPNTIFRALLGVEAQGQPITLETVMTFIHDRQISKDKKGELWPEDFDARVLVHYTHSNFGFEEGVLFYANRMRMEGLKREAEGKLIGLTALCQQYANDPAEIATGLHDIANFLEDAPQEKFDLSNLMARIIDQVENGKTAMPLPTPWPILNRILKGGIVPGELAILAARPGMGKTALAGCLALETARAGKPCLFISREVKDLTIGARLLAREKRIDLSCFRQHIGNAPNILTAIKDGANRISHLPLHIVEKSIMPMCPQEIRRQAKSCRNIGLVVVDYLQLLNPDTKQSSREREVADMSRAMKQLALDCDCPVLLLSQLNRQSEECNREPRLSDLRESGAIEQDADIVMFLHAKKQDMKLANMPVKLIVAKGRSSGTGATGLLFDKPFADFTEATYPEVPENNFQNYAEDNDL